MTIDISQLSPEKRAFLKTHPDFLKGLRVEAPKQARKIHDRREKLKKTKSHHEQELEKLAEEYSERYMLDPALREISSKLTQRVGMQTTSKLVCPVCGDSDKGNRMNGVPWCLKCKSPLVLKKKLGQWKKATAVKVLPKTLKDELKKLHPGLHPEAEKP